MDKISFTPDQETAVKYRGGSLLVSAAAGSGKTKVLVERLLDRIEDGDNVDEFLVITYTRAAAAELRERIHDELLNRIAENTENRRLRRQSILCRSASIGTIHSFCTDILRDSAHLANISPDFRVADEHESEIIKAAILEDVLDKAYETIKTSDGFRALIDATLAGRDDKRLSRMILDVHAKLQSDPDPRKWAQEQIEKLSMSGVKDISETAWGKHLIDKTRGRTLYWRGETLRLREEMRIHPDFEKAYGPGIDAAIADCDIFLNAMNNGWEEARSCGGIEFVRPKPIAGYDSLKKTRNKCKTGLGKCTAVFECSSDDHLEDMQAIAPAMTALMQLILDFDSAYAEEKRSRRVVDFSDLEHLTLPLLINRETGEKTELARAVSRRYKEIMVDEYQDVNAVQELIFNAVSTEGKNIFMVGDVKQSIYRFRLADPSIFLGKYKNTATAEISDRGEESGELGAERTEAQTPDPSPMVSDPPPALVLLSKNFRSRKGILDFVNNVFEKIMSEEFGEMDYMERERLVPGRAEDEDADPAVELSVIDLSAADSDDDDDSPDKAQIEARFIAKRIAELTDGAHMIPDGQGGVRRVDYSDIVILLRSVSGKAWQYAGALSECGIPVDTLGSEGYFETVEVSAMLSLMSVIDNPMQDIPLAAALRGPVYGFTADELAEIRAGSRGTDFYSALAEAAGSNEKCAAFLEEIDGLRLLAPDMSVVRFIWHVYNKTGLPGRVGAMRGGENRRNNLIILAEYARRFEQNGYKGLFSFLTYMSNLQERGVEPAGIEAAISHNVVRIMSIHKSKGLEFPIVFLADTSKQFNYKDMQKPLVMHTGFGVGVKRMDRLRGIEYPTIARLAIQSRLKAEMLAEELRVLYVAMTRAREKLIVTAAIKDADAQIANYKSLQFTSKIPAEVLEDIKSMAGWVLAAVAPSLQETGDRKQGEEGEQAANFRFTMSGEREREEEAIAHGRSYTGDMRGLDSLAWRGDGASFTAYVERLREQFSFVYPHERAPDLPSKLTVTELKGRYAGTDTGEAAEMLRRPLPGETRKRRFAFTKPGFIAERTDLTAAERGTALHLAMQHIDFDKCVNLDGVNAELRRLSEQGALTIQQADASDAQKIARFFESAIGKRLLKADKIEREFKFSLLSPAESFFPGGGGDSVLVQGIVDCFFEEDGEIIVVDFKTDHVTADTLEEAAKDYAPQLAAYSDALERITRKCVKERVIYFFEPEAAYSV